MRAVALVVTAVLLCVFCESGVRAVSPTSKVYEDEAYLAQQGLKQQLDSAVLQLDNSYRQCALLSFILLPD
jgi:hypothetical protein